MIIHPSPFACGRIPETREGRMQSRMSSTEGGKTRWAYAYEITPAQPLDLLRSIQVLLDDEHADAVRTARTWGSRLVVEPRVTRILVVSDSPQQDLEVNRRLEAALRELGAGFSLTIPLAVEE